MKRYGKIFLKVGLNLVLLANFCHSVTWPPPEYVCGGTVGKYTSLKIDSQNKVHLVYQASVTKELIYVHSDNWEEKKVIDTGGKFSSLSLRNGRPCVVHYNPAEGQLKYCWLDESGEWQKEIIKENCREINFVSLDIDTNGNPGILFGEKETDGNKYEVQFVCKSGNEFIIEKIGKTSSWYGKILFKEGNIPTVAYSGSSTLIKYGEKSGAEWQWEEIEKGEGSFSFALSPAGKPFFITTREILIYKENETWRRENLEINCEHLHRVKIVITQSDKIEICGISSFGWGKIWYFYQENEVWQKQEVDNSRELFGYLSIDATPDKIGISYWAEEKGGSCKLAFCNPPSRQWEIKIIENRGIKGLTNSLVYDTHNNPLIFYPNFSQKRIELARKEQNRWIFSSLSLIPPPKIPASSFLGDGSYESFCAVVKRDGTLCLAYHDENDKLRYTEFRNGSWSNPVLIDNIAAHGQRRYTVKNISLKISPLNNHPVIVYLSPRGDPLSLKCAFFNGTTWTKTIISRNCSFPASLCFNQEGQPTVGYRDWNRGLVIAQWNGSLWRREIVYRRRDNLGPVNSVAVSSSGDIHVVSFTFQEEVYYRVYQNGRWQPPEEVPNLLPAHINGYLELFLINDKKPVFLYSSVATQGLVWCEKEGSQWESEYLFNTYHPRGNFGPFVSWDNEGNPGISFSSNGTILYLGGELEEDERSPIEKSRRAHSLLSAAYPNPFNPECWIPIEISERRKCKIRIYNLLGQLVREIEVANQKLPVQNSIYWDGRDSAGLEVPSGMYFYEVAGQNVRRMVVLK